MLFCYRLEDGDCGRVSASQELIFGGENSRPGEFPFTALIRQNLTRQTESLQVRDSDVATSALLCHKDTAQDTQSPLRRTFLAFRCVFMA